MKILNVSFSTLSHGLLVFCWYPTPFSPVPHILARPTDDGLPLALLDPPNLPLGPFLGDPRGPACCSVRETQESPRALRPSAGSSPSARGRLSSLLASLSILVPEELLPCVEGHPGAFPFGSRLAHSAVRTRPTHTRAGPLPKRGRRSLDFLNSGGIFPKDENTKALCWPEILKLKGTSWPSAQRDPSVGSIDSQGVYSHRFPRSPGEAGWTSRMGMSGRGSVGAARASRNRQRRARIL